MPASVSVVVGRLRASVLSFSTRGCLPALLVSETLRTLQLLFPDNDTKSRRFLAKEITEKHLDPRLAKSFQLQHGLHERPEDALLPYNMQHLFERFPHWGERLYTILREAEDPTSMIWYERWSDRRKSPRYAYWVTTIALGLAIFFGVATTILGALQVWISYRSWKESSG